LVFLKVNIFFEDEISLCINTICSDNVCHYLVLVHVFSSLGVYIFVQPN
jgi:hypothetical protein